MAVSDKPRSRFWSRLHFGIRFLGLTGIPILAVGLVVAILGDLLTLEALRVNGELLGNWVQGAGPRPRLALLLLGGGLVAGLFALLIEVLVILRVVAGRRSAFGMSVLAQVGLALILLVGVNVYSAGCDIDFSWLARQPLRSEAHYARIDLTRDQRFTLPDKLQEDLRKLRDETTIIVYQRHKSFGQLADKPDAFASAAERVVVEKLKDLVDQFRELGPRFKVEVLDTEDVDYDVTAAGLTERLAENSGGKLTAKSLRDEIETAPESSVFFVSGGKVQRLRFGDFYYLDKKASQEAQDGSGNLVLLYQGPEPLARKILNIDERRPRIAALVIHSVLGFDNEGDEETLTFNGGKKALAARGFDTRDVVLKKWGGGPPEAVALTYDEFEFDRLEARVARLDEELKDIQDELKDNRKARPLWQDLAKANESFAILAVLGQGRGVVDRSLLPQITKKLRKGEYRIEKITEKDRKSFLESIEEDIDFLQTRSDLMTKRRETLASQMAKLNVDGLAEQRRISDLKAKLDRQLADCDLLIVPRMTIFNAPRGEMIQNRLYRLEQAQIDAIKGFLKAGKPVLFCIGPVNEPAGRPDPGELDQLEEALADLGVQMPKQTVLFNSESEAFAEQRAMVVQGETPKIPPVLFDWQPGAGRPRSAALVAERPANALRQSMQLAGRALGKDKGLDLKLRHPRPVYFQTRDLQLNFDPEVMMASADSWNDDQPFPGRERIPRHEPSKPDDPARGTVEEKRRGPFPIAVAAETTVPASWYGSEAVLKPARARFAVIGHGGVFMGPEINSAKETLLLNTCNWLLGRDDLLPKDDQPWSYPRVELPSKGLWEWGMQLGLPVLFAYLGLVVLLFRRLR